MSASVSLFVVSHRALAVTPTRDDGGCAALPEQAAQRIGVIAFIGEEVTHASGPSEECGRCCHVGDIARRQAQRVWPADNVGEGMDFRRPAAP